MDPQQKVQASIIFEFMDIYKYYKFGMISIKSRNRLGHDASVNEFTDYLVHRNSYARGGGRPSPFETYRDR